MEFALPIVIALIALGSILISPKVNLAGAFYKGLSAEGKTPGLLTLTFSQVTTWIFARSLLNAAILGFHYGIWGTLGYAAYYLSFLTGGRIIDSLRFEHGYDSVQGFLQDRFGHWGTVCYNVVIGVRLVSEVFANLLVIGILFGGVASDAYVLAILGLAAVTLIYSMLGGLYASLRTDLLQMGLFIVVLLALMMMALGSGQFAVAQLGFIPFRFDEPGPILILVALLQIWSYPMHDPVMMDRGFLADRETTRRSFHHAAWISGLCILLFGSLGVFAGAHAAAGEQMNQVLQRLLGEGPMLLFAVTLVLSAMSTLDSTLASSAKLVVVDMRNRNASLAEGRWVMAVFMLLGLALVFTGNKDLFSAVAVSGTVSLYLAPVIVFSLWGGLRDIPVASYVTTFMLALLGGALYFTESSGYSQLLGAGHKYTKLLMITATVLAAGMLLFWLGRRLAPRRAANAVATV